MTDNEIVKALECCIDCYPEDCRECPYVECTTRKGCADEMITDALALINRQKETIEQLQTALFKCGEETAEVEIFKKIAENQQRILMNRFFEIQRLKKEIERLHKDCDELYEQMSERLKAELKIERRLSRAEAVKEFAKSLKKKETTAIRCNRFEGVISTDDIDNLVKEFTEGGDGGQSLQEKLP